VSPAAVASLTRIAIALALAIGLAGFLSYYYRSERHNLAQRESQEGKRLADIGQYEQAIGKYRSALSISHSREDRIALANALTEAGHLAESEAAFEALLRDNPNSGRANLGMARVAAKQENLQQAVHDYQRALYGSWADAPAASKPQARQELVEVLNRLGQRERARAELMAWKSEAPTDARPHAGLGEADLEAGDFANAQAEFREAVRLAPANTDYGARLQFLDTIAEMDPAIRGLTPSQRAGRSLKLLQASAEALDGCAPENASEALDLMKQVRRQLQSRASHESSDANVSLALQVWAARGRLCANAAAPDALSRLMAQLTR
jgi:tetratricopeptide (TPR) repeat protein